MAAPTPVCGQEMVLVALGRSIRHGSGMDEETTHRELCVLLQCDVRTVRGDGPAAELPRRQFCSEAAASARLDAARPALWAKRRLRRRRRRRSWRWRRRQRWRGRRRWRRWRRGDGERRLEKTTLTMMRRKKTTHFALAPPCPRPWRRRPVALPHLTIATVANAAVAAVVAVMAAAAIDCAE